MNERFITQPFLPTRKVSTCVVSCDATDVIDDLRSLGLDVLVVNKSNKLPSTISSHADLQVLPLGERRIAVNDEQHMLMDQLYSLGFDVLPVSGFLSKYPNDCLLNHLLIGDLLFGNTDIVPKDIVSLNLFKPIKVRQGYTKCSSIVLDEHTVLTDDESISRTVSRYNKHVIFIKQNEVLLEGYDHGFIGGTCGKLDEQTLYVSGRIPNTVFGETLKKELESAGMYYLEIGKGKLRDIGGIIPILTE